MSKLSIGLRVTRGFAIVGYLVALGLYFTPVTMGATSPSVVFSLCPAAVLTMTVDPSLVSVALVLGPINALLYGCIGLIVGFGIQEYRESSMAKKHTRPAKGE